MTYLVTDLLDLSALESGEALIRMPVITREITAATLKHLDAKRLARKQQIFTHFEAETLLADPRRVEQVLVNLIHNAIKYTPEGSPIELRVSREDSWVRFDVRDRGPGIKAEDTSRIFDKFYRAEGLEMSGTGLGLFIAKGIVDAHQGKIQARLRQGGGLEISCWLPGVPA